MMMMMRLPSFRMYAKYCNLIPVLSNPILGILQVIRWFSVISIGASLVMTALVEAFSAFPMVVMVTGLIFFCSNLI